MLVGSSARETQELEAHGLYDLFDVTFSHEVHLSKLVHHLFDRFVRGLKSLHGYLERVLERSRNVLLGNDTLLQKVLYDFQGVETVAVPRVALWDIRREHLKEPVCLQGLSEILGLWIVEVH